MSARNITLYPWFKFFQNLVFWQAIWFLYFQSQLSAAEAVMLYAIYDIATTALEVPSGYMSDRWGRRRTLIAAGIAGALGTGLIALGSGFAVFALAQVLLGAQAAFASGTDSALLYESLAQEGRADEVEAQETRAWRFNLIALGLSAITGGLIAQWSFGLAFAAGTLAMVGALGLTLRFVEPQRQDKAREKLNLAAHVQAFRDAIRQPVLAWLFALSVLMYGYSHLPFVFGQPFIADALGQIGWQAEAPMVSGAVTAVMMGVSVLATLIAVGLRQRIGLPAILLLAFAIQLLLIGTLSVTSAILAIAVLFLRMVPNSFARPFMLARMQPLLSDASRATFLSVQSFGGRLLFAATLFVASAHVPDGSVMAHEDIRRTLTWYFGAGVVFFALLALSAARAGVAPPKERAGENSAH